MPGAKRLSVFLFFYGTSKRLKESKRELQFELKGLEKKSLFCWHLFVYFFHIASSVVFSSEAP